MPGLFLFTNNWLHFLIIKAEIFSSPYRKADSL